MIAQFLWILNFGKLFLLVFQADIISLDFRRCKKNCNELKIILHGSRFLPTKNKNCPVYFLSNLALIRFSLGAAFGVDIHCLISLSTAQPTERDNNAPQQRKYFVIMKYVYSILAVAIAALCVYIQFPRVKFITN